MRGTHERGDVKRIFIPVNGEDIFTTNVFLSHCLVIVKSRRWSRCSLFLGRRFFGQPDETSQHSLYQVIFILFFALHSATPDRCNILANKATPFISGESELEWKKKKGYMRVRTDQALIMQWNIPQLLVSWTVVKVAQKKSTQ